MTAFDRIQLVILSHNRLDCLPRLFDELLLPAAQHGVQVTFVDNASKPEVRQLLSQFERTPGLEIILSQENLGVAAGRNLGFKCSQREFSVYLDDDALVTLDTLERVPTVFDELPSAAILAFRIVNWSSGACQNEHGSARVIVGNFHGAAHAIRRTAFAKVGYLDEFCFFGAEEIEYSMRVRVSGWTTIYIPDIQAMHFSFWRSGKYLLQRQIPWARNYAMVLFRYLPYRTASLFSLRLFVSHLLSGAKNGGIGIARLPFAMIQGMIKGIRSRNPLDAEGVAFYSDPNNRPEIGNVSITLKVLRRLFHSS